MRHCRILVGLLILSACTPTSTNAPAESPATSRPAATTTVLRAPSGGLLVPDCDDGGTCGFVFVLDNGILYDMLCVPARADAVTDTVLGTGDFYDETTVNAVPGVPEDLIVAVAGPGPGSCAEPREAEWLLAYAVGARRDLLDEAICAVGELTDAEREAQGCT